MNVLVTLVVFAAAGMWALAVVNRLSRLRTLVKLAWKRLESDQADAAVRGVYNEHVRIYNAALEAFPAIWIGPLAGFKPARKFDDCRLPTAD